VVVVVLFYFIYLFSCQQFAIIVMCQIMVEITLKACWLDVELWWESCYEMVGI
jgi:hypothetical protein